MHKYELELKGIVHCSDNVEQQAFHSRQSTTSRKTHQRLSRVSNKKSSRVMKKTNFCGNAIKGAATHYTMTRYIARIHLLWIDAVIDTKIKYTGK